MGGRGGWSGGMAVTITSIVRWSGLRVHNCGPGAWGYTVLWGYTRGECTPTPAYPLGCTLVAAGKMRAGGICSSSKSGKRSEGGPGEGVGLRQGLSIQAWTSKRVGLLGKTRLVKVTAIPVSSFRAGAACAEHCRGILLGGVYSTSRRREETDSERERLHTQLAYGQGDGVTAVGSRGSGPAAASDGASVSR